MPAFRHLSIRIPVRLWTDFHAIARRRGTVSQILRELVADYVARDRRARRREAAPRARVAS